VNAKRVWRLCAEQELSIRSKQSIRKRDWRRHVGRTGAAAPNEVWSMDFIAAQLFDDHTVRILTVLDGRTRERRSSQRYRERAAAPSMWSRAGSAGVRSGPAEDAEGGQRAQVRRLPAGPAGPSEWEERDVSRPGKPTDNVRTEPFNAQPRADAPDHPLKADQSPKSVLCEMRIAVGLSVEGLAERVGASVGRLGQERVAAVEFTLGDLAAVDQRGTGRRNAVAQGRDARRHSSRGLDRGRRRAPAKHGRRHQQRQSIGRVCRPGGAQPGVGPHSSDHIRGRRRRSRPAACLPRPDLRRQ
jgi:putative transposase